jgi:predicted DNA-binding transcriptional regulator YafY
MVELPTRGPMPDQRHVAKRLVRVLHMLRLIQSEPRQWTRARLAAHFGISERMCDNDIRLLRLAGVDIRRHRGMQGAGYALSGSEPAPTVCECTGSARTEVQI